MKIFFWRGTYSGKIILFSAALFLAGCGAPTSAPTAAESKPDNGEKIRCPRGFVNCPYPGKCGAYTDKNGNGICDYSEVSNQ